MEIEIGGLFVNDSLPNRKKSCSVRIIKNRFSWCYAVFCKKTCFYRRFLLTEPLNYVNYNLNMRIGWWKALLYFLVSFAL